MMVVNIAAYGKPSVNSNMVTTIELGRTVTEKNCKQIVGREKELKLVFEFSEQPENEEMIKQEVRTILECALQDSLKKQIWKAGCGIPLL